MKLKNTKYIPRKPYKTETTKKMKKTIKSQNTYLVNHTKLKQKKNEENYKIKSEPTKKTTNLNNPNIQNSRTKNNTNPRRTQKRK